MTDVRLKQYPSLDVTMDFFLRNNGMLDEREVLATSVRVALGTDRLADASDILPDPDSTDRRGWWGDMDAEAIWDGWQIGTKNWLLARAKITDAPSEEGSTLERARQYTLDALQPFIDKGVASETTVSATREELQRIVVQATVYRGPLPEINLRYQLLWENMLAVEPPRRRAIQIPDATFAGDLRMVARTVAILRGAADWKIKSKMIVKTIRVPDWRISRWPATLSLRANGTITPAFKAKIAANSSVRANATKV